MPIIYGLIERITYHNEENDFVVAKLQEKGKRELPGIKPQSTERLLQSHGGDHATNGWQPK